MRGEVGGVLPERGFPTDTEANPVMILTKQTIEALFNCGSPNSRQLATLRIRPTKGWMQRLIGTVISDALYAELIDCKGRRPIGLPKAQWKKPCIPTE